MLIGNTGSFKLHTKIILSFTFQWTINLNLRKMLKTLFYISIEAAIGGAIVTNPLGVRMVRIIAWSCF